MTQKDTEWNNPKQSDLLAEFGLFDHWFLIVYLIAIIWMILYTHPTYIVDDSPQFNGV